MYDSPKTTRYGSSNINSTPYHMNSSNFFIQINRSHLLVVQCTRLPVYRY
ncbi:hypothetical protein PAHAL_9G226000 [Panicum hallii]|uniref:Uncharacterized protein n=1 Tax=Panicum hallii TaxID=206008 RepID=A0A2T8I261_9POAL|nr:hypothetical protein PAHAL_9G226000 [Panicum hallii]